LTLPATQPAAIPAIPATVAPIPATRPAAIPAKAARPIPAKAAANKLTTKAITETIARAPIPATKTRHADGGGLFLLRTNTGAMSWRMRYRFAGTERELVFGLFPDLSLADARAKRDDIRSKVANGIDPEAVKREEAKAARARPATFRRFGQDVLDAMPRNTAKVRKTARKWDLHLGYAIDHFGDTPVADLWPDEVATWLVDTFGDRLDTLQSVKQKIDRVLRKARLERVGPGPFAETLRGELPTPTRRSFPAITKDPAQFGELLRKIDGHRGSPMIRAALQFQALTFQRPGMIYAMTWDQVDFVNAVWAIPAEGMKGPDGVAQDHLVPLSRQTLAVLEAMKPITGTRLDANGHPMGLVFPGRYADEPMSNNSLNTALKRLGFKGVHCPHGFRASATTMLLERLGYGKGLIDVAVAHVVKDPNGAAYNRAQWIDQRTAMFAAWADYCDTLRAGTTNVHAFKAAA
jgi:integrase